MTPASAALAERHRVAQGRIGAATAAGMLRLFPLLISGGQLDANTPRWLEVVLALLTRQRAQSAALAQQFATAYRVLELGPETSFVPTPALTLDVPALTTSLSVTGAVAYRREVARQLNKDTRELTEADLAGTPLPPALQTKIAATQARAAMRHVQNGARETLDDVMQRDKNVVGYVRTTSATPCWFCAMLASRGPVYEKDSFEDSDPRFQGPGDQKVHDGCGCMLLPMYRRVGEQWPGRAKEFDQLWRETGSALAFRRRFEGR